MTEVPVTDWANYEGDLPERYPHRQPRKSGRGTEPIHGPDRAAYGNEKKRRLKARSPTLTVTKVEPYNHHLNTLTFENGLKAGHAKSKNAKVGDKFVVSSQDGRFAHIMDAEANAVIVSGSVDGEPAMFSYEKGTKDELGFTPGRITTGKNVNVIGYGYDVDSPELTFDRFQKGFKNYKNNVWRKHMRAEEGNAPIQDPMEFGEMANWTPLDGSEGLKRKRAEDIQVENVMAGEDTKMIYVSTYEAAVEEAERFIRHYFPADYTYSYHIHETDQPNRWEMVYGKLPQGEEAFLHNVVKASESPSATIPVNEPSWVKPVATALGFALGFFGIHELKKVL